MKIINGISDERPPIWAIGTESVICYTDISEEEIEMEEPSIKFTYTAYILAPTEYEEIIQGTFKGEWNEEFRRLERTNLLTLADQKKQKAQDYIDLGIEKSKWLNYSKKITEYKMGVRETINQESFPESVIYPELPENP